VIRTAESVVFTLCPPGRGAHDVDLELVLVDLDLDVLDLGHDATVAVEVWMRPCDSVSGTRCTRWVPPSNLKIENAPWPFTANTASLTPPPSLSLVESASVRSPIRSA
jgi:hypothetical protein